MTCVFLSLYFPTPLVPMPARKGASLHTAPRFLFQDTFPCPTNPVRHAKFTQGLVPPEMFQTRLPPLLGTPCSFFSFFSPIFTSRKGPLNLSAHGGRVISGETLPALSVFASYLGHPAFTAVAARSRRYPFSIPPPPGPSISCPEPRF